MVIKVYTGDLKEHYENLSIIDFVGDIARQASITKFGTNTQLKVDGKKKNELEMNALRDSKNCSSNKEYSMTKCPIITYMFCLKVLQFS